MPDSVDQISEGKKIRCPFWPKCDETREDIDPNVALQLINNHVRKTHKEG